MYFCKNYVVSRWAQGECSFCTLIPWAEYPYKLGVIHKGINIAVHQLICYNYRIFKLMKKSISIVSLGPD